MTYETETQNAQKSRSSDRDVLAAWLVYIVIVFGLVGYSLVSVFA